MLLKKDPDVVTVDTPASLGLHSSTGKLRMTAATPQR